MEEENRMEEEQRMEENRMEEENRMALLACTTLRRVSHRNRVKATTVRARRNIMGTSNAKQCSSAT